MHSGLAQCVQIPKLNGSHQGVMVIWCGIHLVTYSNRKKIEPFKRARRFHFCQQFPVLWKSNSISQRKQGIYQIIPFILEGAKIKIQLAQKPSASKERVHGGAGHLWELFLGVESSYRVLSRQPN